MKYPKIAFWCELYVFIGLLLVGLTFFLAPDLAQRIFLSNFIYRSEIVRFVGVLLVAISSLVCHDMIRSDKNLIFKTLISRTIVLAGLVQIYLKSLNTMFLIFIILITLGYLFSIYALFKDRGRKQTSN